jgi:hypothetical protein
MFVGHLIPHDDSFRDIATFMSVNFPPGEPETLFKLPRSSMCSSMAALISARGFCLPRSALITLLPYRTPRDRLLLLAAPLGLPADSILPVQLAS